MRSAKFIKWLIILVVLMNSAILFFSIISKKDVRGAEGNVLFTIEKISEDNSKLYQDIFEAPYHIAQYSPLYYMMSDAVLSVLDLSDENKTYQKRITLRIMSFLCLVVLLVYAMKITILIFNRILSRNEKLLFILAIITITCPWFYLCRPDVLVSLFFVLSLYTFLKSEGGNSIKHIILLGLFSCLAVLSKQNGLLIIPVIFIAFFYWKNFKALAFYCLGIVISFIAFAFTYDLLGYSTENIFQNLVIGVSNGIAIREAFLFAIVPFTILFGLPFLIIFRKALRNKAGLVKDPNLFFLVLFVLVNFAFASLTCLKYGSAENYFNDTIIFSIILAFYLFKDHTKYLLRTAFIYCLAISSYQFVSYVPLLVNDLKNKDHYVHKEKLSAFLEKELKEDEYFFTDLRALGIEHHERAVFMPYEVYSASSFLEHGSKMKYFKAVEKAQAENIEWVILHKESLVFNVWREHFELHEEWDGVEVYRRN